LKLLNEIFAEMSVKLNGAILRKAELENNFKDVYTKIFERVAVVERFGTEFLEIFGDMGG